MDVSKASDDQIVQELKKRYSCFLFFALIGESQLIASGHIASKGKVFFSGMCQFFKGNSSVRKFLGRSLKAVSDYEEQANSNNGGPDFLFMSGFKNKYNE